MRVKASDLNNVRKGRAVNMIRRRMAWMGAMACCLTVTSYCFADAQAGQIRGENDALRCERLCQAQATRVERACLELGGGADECAQRAAQAKEHCLVAACAPENNCGQGCVIKAKEAYKECVDNGHDPHDCGLRARALLKQCLEENCPPPNNCKRRCAHQAAEVNAACLEMGGDPDDCAQRARHHFERCVEAHCIPPRPCAAQGVEKGWEILRECRLTGTAADLLPCIERAKEAVFNCIAENCDFPIGCEDRCVNVSARLYHACREFGGSKAACALYSCRFLSYCLDEKCSPDCGGIIGAPCDDDEFCKFAPGQCHVADNVGSCIVVPAVCPDIFLPVCGCDGETYGNECEADMAGVSIEHRGACDDTANADR